ncbi:hypothetical protein BU24DRAFT_376368 [Aaosphaeria arxii CBS 175.79]|uniref:Zn(2)-C6 fungal-type domain-containing protein n=1 Tax=Aaosphaeria arxii CBS 175.79 TaxID=1450172 RepID=A0A6A5XDQ9_9PLEO|nr:uncharacterized protein BU24DRAFT_376368 [Aaosphaeria arxii CBS 175.79]KAF2011285.1 hypothetical protein BU24DRAFT_376368 [Aaosphaeria arxii CBS 175.79]
MNFVDAQPASFLDYAWTTPSDNNPNKPAKPSKTSRKQNRCCDQCRKGKRACDAAILEDSLLDKNGSSEPNPTVFHYSDVFGPLAPCSNCEKTKKTCTFEWLRSQRVSQAAPQQNPAPPTKRRRKSSPSKNAPNDVVEAAPQQLPSAAPPPTVPDAGGDFVAQNEGMDFGLTFADIPIPSFDFSHSALSTYQHAPLMYDGLEHTFRNGSSSYDGTLVDESDNFLELDSGKGSSFDTSSERLSEGVEGNSPNGDLKVQSSEEASTCNSAMVRIPRKRRRRSSSSLLSDRLHNPLLSLTNNLFLSTNSTFLTEGLLRIYHDSFENALSCWLTERTCPYSKGSEVSLANDAGPDWNRIYYRVFRLDRLASSIRGRALSFREDKASSKALNLAIFSFATQWAQSSQRSKAKYPFHSDGSDDKSTAFSGNNGILPMYSEFDRTLQVTAWNEARQALQEAREIESFRVVLAHIVFSLTQRPQDPIEDPAASSEASFSMSNGVSTSTGYDTDMLNTSSNQQADTSVDDCEELLSKLNLTIESEDPPIYLEQGLRLIHSLRSRMAITGTMNKLSRRARSSKPNPNRLTAADNATVDLLFWLGVMFDTVSSAVHKRPLVVPDEDSDIYALDPRPADDAISDNGPLDSRSLAPASEGLWDGYLFARQRKRLSAAPVRWPCSYEQAAAVLCDAAPVKVLLFRKITRVQTLLSRNARGDRIEKALKESLDVYNHWNQLYAPFIRDCIDNHDSLPPRVQSWYICLTGHFHLAALLFAELVEIIDDSELSVETMRQSRNSSKFIAVFRARNCQTLSDLAQCACPREGASFPKSQDFHFAVNSAAILTEPWTAVLIQAFAKAGVLLLESESSAVTSISNVVHQEDSFRRADECVKALWYLGRKSDMALAAARILGDALKQRRKGVEEKLSDMSSFLRPELWEGYEDMADPMSVECVS